MVATETQVRTAQQQCIEDHEGKWLVIAGPGTGKTYTITKRIQNMIENNINPEEILCLTFSDTAAKEMRNRVGENYPINVFTFHSFCLNIMEEFKNEFDLDEFQIITDSHKRTLITECITEMKPKAYRDEKGNSFKFIKTILDNIDEIKKNRIRKEEYLDAINTNPLWLENQTYWKQRLDDFRQGIKGRLKTEPLKQYNEATLKVEKARELWDLYEAYESKKNDKKYIDFNDMMTKFSEWISFAKYTSVGEVFDIGKTTLKAIVRFQDGIKPLEAGLLGENYNGNGSLMRMVPIAFYAYVKELSENDIIDLVCDASSLTHRHEISLLGCYIYVRYMIFLLNGYDKLKSYELIKKLDYSFVSFDSYDKYRRILKGDIIKEPLDNISSSGYIVDTLESVFWCVNNTDNFQQAIIGSVNLGGDTDTIGALTGAIAGIIYGFDSIPKKWINNLQKKEYLKLMYTSFIKTLNHLG